MDGSGGSGRCIFTFSFGLAISGGGSFWVGVAGWPPGSAMLVASLRGAADTEPEPEEDLDWGRSSFLP